MEADGRTAVPCRAIVLRRSMVRDVARPGDEQAGAAVLLRAREDKIRDYERTTGGVVISLSSVLPVAWACRGWSSPARI